MGLGIPRAAVHLVEIDGAPHLVNAKDSSIDHTELAKKTFEKITPELKGASGIVLTKGSPSCGNDPVKLYHPEKKVPFGKSRGLFALHVENAYPLIPRIDSGRLYDKELRENFCSQVQCFHSFQAMELKPRYLVKLHEEHKFYFLQYGDQFLKKLGRICSGIDNKNILPVNCDALQYDYERYSGNYKALIVGNLPFNISSQLLMRWIVDYEWPPFYSKMILMFQKEVAERILASHNQKIYGRISVITQARCKVKKLLYAPANIFFPKPRVDGVILEFTPMNKYINVNISNLQKIVRQSFEQRRKKIKTSLKDYSHLLRKYKIDDDLRAENLSVDDYCKLASGI